MKSFNKPINFLFLALFFFTPLIFTQSNSELFELPKMYFVYLLTILITTFHLFNFFQKKAPLHRKTFLDIPLILFLLSQTISTIYSIDPHTSFYGYYSRLNGGLLSLICYILLFKILVIYIDDKLKKQIIDFSLLSGLLISIYAIAQHFGIDKNWWVQDVQSRVFSTFGQPNWLAAYFCILIPFATYKFLESKSLIHKSYFLILTSTFYLSLLFTKSKSGIIACLISLATYFIFKLILDIKNKFFFRNLKSYLVLPLLIVLTFSVNNPIKEKIFFTRQSLSDGGPQKQTESKLLITSSGNIRKIVWTGAIDLWKKFPIFGTGTETFAYSYYWTRPASHNLTSEWDYLYNKAHNEYINYLATTGIVGLLTYFIIIIITLIFLFLNHKSKLFLPLLSSYLTILITNFAGFSVVITSLYFFLIPCFLFENPNITPPKPNKSKLRLLIIPATIISLILIKKVTFFYLADIFYSQAESYDSKNDYSTALGLIKISHQYNPQEPLYTDKLSSLYAKIALSTKNQDDIDQAIKFSDLTVNISPANVNFWKQRAQTYLYLSAIDSKYFTESLTSLSKASVLAPTDAKIYYSIGQFLETADLKKEAIPYYQKAIELKPNYDYAYFALAKIYLDQKETQLAKENLQKTIEYSYPTNTEAENLLKKIP